MAPLTGAALYAAAGAVGGFVPGSGATAVRVALIAGAAYTAAWYAVPRLRFLPSPDRQMRKVVAISGIRGAVVYGGVLGIGVLTIVASPLVWIGALAALVSGSWRWGALYGVSFGGARILHFAWQRSLGVPADRSQVVVRVLRGRISWAPVVGIIGAVGIAGLALAGFRP